MTRATLNRCFSCRGFLITLPVRSDPGCVYETYACVTRYIPVRVHIVHTMHRSCVRARTHTLASRRVRFPRRAAVWVEGTHGRRKQRIMVITVIKRRPLRTRPGSTWKIRYFTFECRGTIRKRGKAVVLDRRVRRLCRT